ncbi:hypothetical protein SAMN02745866_00322 [Alteromonadaceae bacterium Bs31]|nr:hypothetical protein SAMN02745866_00322 [Alteromonadaceae bacterium Bs31]
MREVTKSEFKDAYIRYGGLKEGYDLEYWDQQINTAKKTGFKYLLKEPEPENAHRMMLVDDYSSKEIRMFFVSIGQEESIFNS